MGQNIDDVIAGRLKPGKKMVKAKCKHEQGPVHAFSQRFAGDLANKKLRSISKRFDVLVPDDHRLIVKNKPAGQTVSVSSDYGQKNKADRPDILLIGSLVHFCPL